MSAPTSSIEPSEHARLLDQSINQSINQSIEFLDSKIKLLEEDMNALFKAFMPSYSAGQPNQGDLDNSVGSPIINVPPAIDNPSPALEEVLHYLTGVGLFLGMERSAVKEAAENPGHNNEILKKEYKQSADLIAGDLQSEKRMEREQRMRQVLKDCDLPTERKTAALSAFEHSCSVHEELYKHFDVQLQSLSQIEIA